MESERLKLEYSLKTDGELLALLADLGSLSDEALAVAPAGDRISQHFTGCIG